MNQSGSLELNRDKIALLASEREDENEMFRQYLKHMDGERLDLFVHQINDRVISKIDCTQCGACCKKLMINVTITDKDRIASHLKISPRQFKENYLEESSEGQMIMHSMPCSFLSENKCSVYDYRFEECREFPHLHKENFKGRLFGTLMHYGRCPIIFNVIEELKTKTGFRVIDE